MSSANEALPKIQRNLCVAGLLVLLGACGGGGSSSMPVPTFTIGGSVQGLSSSGLELVNGGDTLSPASGATSFTFATAVVSGTAYAVTVKAQPKNELCQVSAGSGTVGAANVTSVRVSCVVNSYAVGGTISGLQGSGLVLVNGNDTVSPAPGAMSFTFAAPVASGSTYAVTVKTPPKGQACQVMNGTGTVSAAVTDVAVTCSRAWTWVSGSDVVGASAVYGTKGVAAAGNVPSPRNSSASWADGSGTLWLFGGYASDSNGYGPMNDLWTFDPGSGEWTWVNGANTPSALGVYGTQGVPAAGNVPGGRSGAVGWIDASGSLWLFGGDAIDSTTYIYPVNDLWTFNPGTGVWTWVSGANTANAPGVYGTRGVPAAGNVPGARVAAVGWTDAAGRFWLFGGNGVDSAGQNGYLNDLWTFDPGTGEWTWVSGSNTANASGVYGTLGMAAAANVPGARYGAVTWTDGSGNLWLFGGNALDSNGAGGRINDLWMFNPATAEWTWVSGANVINESGVYGAMGTPAAGNVPGARYGAASWMDASGNLWLFGGSAWDSTRMFGLINDLWKFDPVTGQWTWVGGANSVNAAGVYGSKGTAAAGNVPGARSDAATWADGSGTFWLFGGTGTDVNRYYGPVNDLWMY